MKMRRGAWEARTDPQTGSRFYFNHDLGTSVWTLPSPPQDFDGWTEQIDPNTKARFFHNVESGQSSWTMPEGLFHETSRGDSDMRFNELQKIGTKDQNDTDRFEVPVGAPQDAHNLQDGGQKREQDTKAAVPFSTWCAVAAAAAASGGGGGGGGARWVPGRLAGGGGGEGALLRWEGGREPVEIGPSAIKSISCEVCGSCLALSIQLHTRGAARSSGGGGGGAGVCGRGLELVAPRTGAVALWAVGLLLAAGADGGGEGAEGAAAAAAAAAGAARVLEGTLPAAHFTLDHWLATPPGRTPVLARLEPAAGAEGGPRGGGGGGGGAWRPRWLALEAGRLALLPGEAAPVPVPGAGAGAGEGLRGAWAAPLEDVVLELGAGAGPGAPWAFRASAPGAGAAQVRLASRGAFGAWAAALAGAACGGGVAAAAPAATALAAPLQEAAVREAPAYASRATAVVHSLPEADFLNEADGRVTVPGANPFGVAPGSLVLAVNGTPVGALPEGGALAALRAAGLPARLALAQPPRHELGAALLRERPAAEEGEEEAAAAAPWVRARVSIAEGHLVWASAGPGGGGGGGGGEGGGRGGARRRFPLAGCDVRLRVRAAAVAGGGGGGDGGDDGGASSPAPAAAAAWPLPALEICPGEHGARDSSTARPQATLLLLQPLTFDELLTWAGAAARAAAFPGLLADAFAEPEATDESVMAADEYISPDLTNKDDDGKEFYEAEVLDEIAHTQDLLAQLGCNEEPSGGGGGGGWFAAAPLAARRRRLAAAGLRAHVRLARARAAAAAAAAPSRQGGGSGLTEAVRVYLSRAAADTHLDALCSGPEVDLVWDSRAGHARAAGHAALAARARARPALVAAAGRALPPGPARARLARLAAGTLFGRYSGGDRGLVALLKAAAAGGGGGGGGKKEEEGAEGGFLGDLAAAVAGRPEALVYADAAVAAALGGRRGGAAAAAAPSSGGGGGGAGEPDATRAAEAQGAALAVAVAEAVAGMGAAAMPGPLAAALRATAAAAAAGGGEGPAAGAGEEGEAAGRSAAGRVLLEHLLVPVLLKSLQNQNIYSSPFQLVAQEPPQMISDTEEWACVCLRVLFTEVPEQSMTLREKISLASTQFQVQLFLSDLCLSEPVHRSVVPEWVEDCQDLIVTSLSDLDFLHLTFAHYIQVKDAENDNTDDIVTILDQLAPFVRPKKNQEEGNLQTPFVLHLKFGQAENQINKVEKEVEFSSQTLSQLKWLLDCAETQIYGFNCENLSTFVSAGNSGSPDGIPMAALKGNNYDCKKTVRCLRTLRSQLQSDWSKFTQALDSTALLETTAAHLDGPIAQELALLSQLAAGGAAAAAAGVRGGGEEEEEERGPRAVRADRLRALLLPAAAGGHGRGRGPGVGDPPTPPLLPGAGGARREAAAAASAAGGPLADLLRTVFDPARNDLD